MAAKFDFIKLIGKMLMLEIVFARVVKYDIFKHFAAVGSVLYVFFLSLQKSEKHASLFKRSLTLCYL